jgi:hypothetical protein
MAFGQAAGPPAPARQVETLASLLEERGYDSFREARHPFGLNQRNAAGKFTMDEAKELLERLEAEAEAGKSGPPPAPTLGNPKADAKAAAKRRDREVEVAAKIDAQVLADELTTRGWCVIPPE